MKTYLCVFICTFLYCQAAKTYGQESINLDLLKAPASPAANLLNISPDQVQHSTDPTDLMVQFGKVTQNFTQLPKSFAIDFAPKWFIKRSTSVDNFNDQKKTIPQTFVISLAYQDTTDVTSDLSPRPSRVALGFKVSIIRGKIRDDTENQIKALTTELKNFASFQKQYEQELNLLESQTDNFRNTLSESKRENLRALELTRQNQLTRISQYKRQLNKVLSTREGCFLDLAAGKVWDFYSKPANIKLSKDALWATFGYEWNQYEDADDDSDVSNFSAMGMIRYQNVLEPLAANQTKGDFANNFDTGVKIVFRKIVPNHFSANFEAIYRESNNPSLQTAVESAYKSSWRFAFNADYEIRPNMKLTLALGRDFAGIVTKEGNLFGLLNFVTGIGSKRILSE